VPGLLSGADVDRALRAIKLRPRFQQIQRCANLGCARGLPCRLVIAALEKGPKPLAADGPSLSVAGEDDIGKCGATGGVKQLLTLHDVAKHFRLSLMPASGC
jgi:hypothetical protein